MSHEIRHFLVFVEQDWAVGRPLPDENIPLQFASALKEHFGALAEKHVSPGGAGADPNASCGDGGDSKAK